MEYQCPRARSSSHCRIFSLVPCEKTTTPSLPPLLKSLKYVPLNLNKLANAIKSGKLDPAYPINAYAYPPVDGHALNL